MRPQEVFMVRETPIPLASLVISTTRPDICWEERGRNSRGWNWPFTTRSRPEMENQLIFKIHQQILTWLAETMLVHPYMSHLPFTGTQVVLHMASWNITWSAISNSGKLISSHYLWQSLAKVSPRNKNCTASAWRALFRLTIDINQKLRWDKQECLSKP